MAKYCARREIEPKNVGEAEWNPVSGGSEDMDAWPSSAFSKGGGGDVSPIDGRWGR